MRGRVEPVRLGRDADGTPFSAAYGDVYHSRSGAHAQARHVFLGGNDLPARWAGRASFTILETGFGLGTGFLATLRAWRDDPARPARLHFVSIERHPVDADDLRAVHAADPALAPLGQALAAQWPLPLPGLHRLRFEDDRVTLSLALGDVAQLLPNLRVGVDAFFLDGFAPARNPAMWSPEVLRALARLARPEATCATWTVARDVVTALERGGFALEKRPGFGTKREMLVGRFAPAWRTRRHEPPQLRGWSSRDAIVIGAGLAGTQVAAALAGRGWDVCILDREAGVARGASGNPAGALHPAIARDDNALARLTRAGFLLARTALARLADPAVSARCGFLECGADDAETARQRVALEVLGFPSGYVDFLEPAAAAERAGQPVARGGLWFPDGGWVRPARWCEALVAAGGARIRTRWRCDVARVAFADGLWRALDADGAVIAAAPVAVIATGTTLARLAGQPSMRLDALRGQLTSLAAEHCRPPVTVVGGDGYCLPAIDGAVVVGASYDDDDDPAPRPAIDDENLARIARLLPGFGAGFTVAHLAGRGGRVGHVGRAGRVGFRAVATDRLPVIGEAVDEAAAVADRAALHSAHCIDVPRHAGLFVAGGLASRGLTGSALAGEIIAALADGEPPPVEADLLDAVDPARLLLRTRRGRGRTAPGTLPAA